ncbi:MAG TPA: cupin domain-containing protein [Ramlibacter sp.]|nr:cupin domain-containing protein [Ramlibacter sp.]
MKPIPTLFRPESLANLPLPAGRLSHQVLDLPDLELRHYVPPKPDPQAPHTRDELYFVHSGGGVFVRAGERRTFQAGDALFVAAGEEHRFEDCSPGTAAWVVFFGPEKPAA